MKKSLLALAAFAASAFVTSVSAEEQSVTYDFNNISGNPYISSTETARQYLGDDWGYINEDNKNYVFRINNAANYTVNGTNYLWTSSSASTMGKGVLMYYAKGPGKITFDATGYGSGCQDDDYIEFYTATYDGSTYTLGETIKKFTGLWAGDVQTLEVEITESGWIGFRAARVCIDNFTNTWETAAPVEPTEEKSVIYDFNDISGNPYISSTATARQYLGDDWGYINEDNKNYVFRINNAANYTVNGTNYLWTSSSASTMGKGVLMYYAKGPGKITFEVTGYGSGCQDDDYVEFYTATYDGETYTLGSSIAKFTELWAGEVVTKEVEIPETGWIGFRAARVCIDNFTNTWVVASVAKSYSVSGTVVNAETEALVEGAKVAIVGGDNVTTGADGAFSFSEMADGEYMVNVSAPGFEAFQTKVTVDGADITDLKFEIAPQKSTLKGYVLSILSDAAPIKGAELSLYIPETETPVATATSDEDGSYALTLSGVLNAGGYTLTMSAPYYQDVTRTISTGGVAPCFRQGETVESTLYMTPKYVAFYANVMDADSTGITTATVLLFPEGAEEPIRAVNYGGGRYGVSNITAANIAPSYTFTVSAPYYDDFTSEAFSFDGKDHTADVILTSETYTFTATVTSRFGAAIEGAIVTVDGNECEAGADGTFTWTVLASEAADETFEAEATAPGYDAQKFEFDFKDAKTVGHTFMLTETKYTLLVFVTDKTDDSALADATVTVKDADGGQLNVTDESNGSFSATVTALSAAKTTYEVTASCEGYITSEAKTVNLAEGSVEITIALEPEPVSLDTIGADAAGQAIFDLQGRRVTNAAKGTITISNGKKTLNL